MTSASIRIIKETGERIIKRYDLALMKCYGAVATLGMQVVAIVLVGMFPDTVRTLVDPGKMAVSLTVSLLATAVSGVWIALKAKSHNKELIRNNDRLPKRHSLPAPDDAKRHRVGRWWLASRDAVMSAIDRIPVWPVLI